jgi:diacylglycerol kinase
MIFLIIRPGTADIRNIWIKPPGGYLGKLRIKDKKLRILMKRFSIKDRIHSFKFAFEGLFHAFKTQHNLWIDLLAAIVVIILGFVYDLNSKEWILIIICIGFVISAEIFNTSIEYLTDLVSPDKNHKAKLVKDLAAAAVFISAVSAFVIGLIIFIPKIF